MNYFKKVETFVIWGLILILGLMYGLLNNINKTPSDKRADQQQEQSLSENTQVKPLSSQVIYPGEEGRTAMDLLKANYSVQTQGFGELGEFVKSIDGAEPDAKHFWAFYVNGIIAQVGADKYTTKASDIIEWKIEEIK